MTPIAGLTGVLLVCACGLEPTVERRAEAARGGPRPWPPALSSHTMVYHDSLEMVLLFGGSREDRTLSDTLWGWDGDRWYSLASGGPPPRIHAGVAYDLGRNRLVVHGGVGDGGTRGDVWEWDGMRWERRDPPAPGPGRRDHHAMIYAPFLGGVVLFGGQDETDEYPGGTWVWDGASWAAIARASPPPRGTHRLAYDPGPGDGQGAVILAGGWGPDGQLADVWELRGRAWVQVGESDPAEPGPGRRGAHRVAFDAARSELVLFGGLGGRALLGDTWTWRRSPSGWTREAAGGPPARNVHGMAYDERRERVVLFGGIGADGRLADLWEWDGRSWSRVGP